MIRLALVTTVPDTVRAFFVGQLAHLRDHGFQVTVFTAPSAPDHPAGQLDLPVGVERVDLELSRVVDPLRDAGALAKLTAHFVRRRFQLVQYVTPKAALLGSLAARAARVPVRLYLQWGLYYVTQRGRRRRALQQVERLVCRLSTDVAPDGPGNLELAIADGLVPRSKARLVGHGSCNGVDLVRFDPDRLAPERSIVREALRLPPNAWVWGCLSSLVHDKGLDELLPAFAEVAREEPDAHLVVVGDAAEKDPIAPATRALLAEHPRIRLLPWTPTPERLLAAFDAFVHPSHREGFGVVNLEAGAMRLPVVTTTVPGQREAVVDGETGLLVPPGEIAPLVQAMRRLGSDRALARRLGAAARPRVQEHWEQRALWDAMLRHRRDCLERAGIRC